MRRKKTVGTTVRNFSRLFHGADRGGKRYPDRLEDLAAVSLAFTADSKPFAVLLDDDLLERLEVLLDMQPLDSVTGSRKTLVQLLSQDQRQKAAKHLPCDVGLVLVENRSGFQKRFHIPEDALHPPQFLVRESGLLPRKTGVGDQDPLSVVNRIGLDFLGIEGAMNLGKMKIFLRNVPNNNPNLLNKVGIFEGGSEEESR
jgi:hypothetical protein